MRYECLRALLHKSADHAGAQVGHFLVGVVYGVHDFAHVGAPLAVEEAEESLDYFGRREYFQLVCVFYIHYLVADVVGSLYYEYERVTGISQRFVVAGEAQHAQLVGHFAEVLFLGVEEAELAFGADGRFKRIFDNGGEGGVGHGEASLASAFELVCEQPEGIGVAFEVREVGPLRRCEHGFELHALALAEEGAYGALSAVSEGRVAKVVGQTGRCHDVAEVVEVLCRPVGVLVLEGLRYVVGHRLAYASHLHAVCESVVHEDAARQRKHLSLVLQSSEGRGEYQTVVVAAEVGARKVLFGVVVVFKAETLVIYQCGPVHFFCHSSIASPKAPSIVRGRPWSLNR